MSFFEFPIKLENENRYYYLKLVKEYSKDLKGRIEQLSLLESDINSLELEISNKIKTIPEFIRNPEFFILVKKLQNLKNQFEIFYIRKMNILKTIHKYVNTLKEFRESTKKDIEEFISLVKKTRKLVKELSKKRIYIENPFDIYEKSIYEQRDIIDITKKIDFKMPILEKRFGYLIKPDPNIHDKEDISKINLIHENYYGFLSFINKYSINIDREEILFEISRENEEKLFTI